MLGDRRVLDWALEAVRSVCDGVVLVLAPERLGSSEAGADVVVGGGETRADSVRAGLSAVPADADVVVVHDAARPLASIRLFEAVVAAVLAGSDAAVPGVPVADTVKRVKNGVVVETLDRSELIAVQTPQAFDARVLRRAHASRDDAPDDAALVEAAGGTVALVPGEPENRKLTTAVDLIWARTILKERRQ
jgi:2-C-methyl-D-erythritol 4-phosphate cytidylyltransferase